jgi:hypothetical protein
MLLNAKRCTAKWVKANVAAKKPSAVVQKLTTQLSQPMLPPP